MNEEKLRLLKMIEEGKISAEEGARLLEALEAGGGGTGGSGGTGGARRSSMPVTGQVVKIRVVEIATGREKVNLSIPLAFAKMFGSLVPESQRAQLEQHGIHLSEILRAVENGETGSLAEMNYADRGERIEVTIE